MEIITDDKRDLPGLAADEQVSTSKKPTDKARLWFLTLWEDRVTVKEIEENLKLYDAYLGQMEKCPDTGRLHYHVLVENEC